MPQIDLRNTTLEIRDGFSLTGAVNQANTTKTAAVNETGPAPADGDSSITVDTWAGTGTVQAGTKFTFAGHATVYTVTSTVGGPITSINFSPALATANGIPLDNDVITFVTGTAAANGNTTVTMDGLAVAIPVGIEMRFTGVNDVYHVVSSVGGSTPTSVTFTPALTTAAGLPADDCVITFGPHVVEMRIGEGTLTYNERQDMEYVRNKRIIQFVRYGDQQPMDVTFNLVWEFIRSDTDETPSVEEVLKHEGNASSYVTSGADVCEPYSVDLRILYTPPCTGVKQEETILKEFRYEGLNHNVKDGTIEASGKCKIGVAVHNRLAASA